MNEDILKKYGITDFEAIEKNEDGTFKSESAIEALVKHVQEMKAKDPDLIKSIKQSASQEASIIARKKILKTLRTKLNLSLSNSEIELMDDDQVADFINQSNSAKSTDDVAKLQADVIKLANEKEALTTSFESQINEIKTSYEAKANKSKFKSQVLELANTRFKDKLFVEGRDAFILFENKLFADGYTFKVNEKGEIDIYKGESIALTENKTAVANLDYFADKYWKPFCKQSNGAGGEGNPTPPPAGTKGQSDKFKELESRFKGG